MWRASIWETILSIIQAIKSFLELNTTYKLYHYQYTIPYHLNENLPTFYSWKLYRILQRIKYEAKAPLLNKHFYHQPQVIPSDKS